MFATVLQGGKWTAGDFNAFATSVERLINTKRKQCIQRPSPTILFKRYDGNVDYKFPNTTSESNPNDFRRLSISDVTGAFMWLPEASPVLYLFAESVAAIGVNQFKKDELQDMLQGICSFLNDQLGTLCPWNDERLWGGAGKHLFTYKELMSDSTLLTCLLGCVICPTVVAEAYELFMLIAKSVPVTNVLAYNLFNWANTPGKSCTDCQWQLICVLIECNYDACAANLLSNKTLHDTKKEIEKYLWLTKSHANLMQLLKPE